MLFVHALLLSRCGLWQKVVVTLTPCISDFIKRNVKFLSEPAYARQLNLTGQRGKRAFRSLTLFPLLYGLFIILKVS